VFLYAELALKADGGRYATQARQAFQLLADSGSAPWKTRGRLGLLRLNATDLAGRQAAARELDSLVASLGKDQDEAAIDAAFLLGRLCEELGQTARAAAAYEYALKMRAHLKDYLGKDCYSGLLSVALLQEALARVGPKKQTAQEEEPLASFKKARKEQGAGRLAKAMELYETVRKGWPEHELAHAAAFRIEECRYGQGEVAPAQENLKKFVAAAPQGPWRGHANLLLGDIRLERFFDPPGAEPFFRAILEEAPRNPHASWKEILPDAHDRLGILAYFRERYEDAVRHLSDSARPAPATER
jgi:tetratricopeptide (TPR) repeat protein